MHSCSTYAAAGLKKRLQTLKASKKHRGGSDTLEVFKGVFRGELTREFLHISVYKCCYPHAGVLIFVEESSCCS